MNDRLRQKTTATYLSAGVGSLFALPGQKIALPGQKIATPGYLFAMVGFLFAPRTIGKQLEVRQTAGYGVG